MSEFEPGKISNLVDTEDQQLSNIENKKRAELLSDIKQKRQERDDMLQKSESLPNRLKDVINLGSRQELKKDASKVQEKLYEDTQTQHEKIDKEVVGQAKKILGETVINPLRFIREFYVKKRSLNENKKDDVDQKVEEQKIVSSFKSENVAIGLSDKRFSKDLSLALLHYLDDPVSKSGINYNENTLIGADGFTIDVAAATLKGLVDLMKNEELVKDVTDIWLLKLINKTAETYPDGLTQDVKDIIANFVVSQGPSFEGYKILKNKSLVKITLESSHRDSFLKGLEQKAETYIKNSSWSNIDAFFFSYSKEVADIVTTKIDKYLFEKFSIHLSDVQKAWDLYPVFRSRADNNLNMNITVMERLEEQRSGIVKTLLEEYGIKEFRRYPNEVLIDQFDNKNNDVPYGAIMFTNDDHNQSFDQKEAVIQSIFEQTKEHGLHIRISEFNSRYSLMKRFASLNSKYGDKNKISYLMLGAHGYKDGFSTNFSTEVNSSDIQGKGVARIKEYLIEDPEILMVSCSTGQEGGIAQEISKAYSAKVHAPTEDTSVTSVKVSLQEGKPTFKVVYRGDVLQEYSQGQKT